MINTKPITINTDVLIGGPADGQKRAIPWGIDLLAVQKGISFDDRAVRYMSERERFIAPLTGEHIYHRERIQINAGYRLTFFRHEKMSLVAALQLVFTLYTENKQTEDN